MAALYFILEQALFLFSAWTVGLHTCVLAGIPVGYAFPGALAIYALLCALIRPDIRKVLASVRAAPGFVSGTVALGLAVASFTLCVFRPDQDDYSFVLRTMPYVRALAAPFHSQAVRAAMSTPEEFFSAHTLNSYEPLLAMLGCIAGKGAVRFYQNFGSAVAAFLAPVTYVLLFRRLRLPRTRAILAGVLVLVFFLVDGASERSFGTFALIRLWQGKAVFATLIPPGVLLFALRFLSKPSPRRLAVVALASVCAVGLSPPGLYLPPVLLLAVSLAYFAAFCRRTKRLGKAAALNLASIYCVPAAAFLFLRTQVSSTGGLAADQSSQSLWWQSVLSVTGSPAVVLRDVAILFLLPPVMRSPLCRRWLLLFTALLVVLYANPLTAPAFIVLLTRSFYWRAFHLLPVPLSCGLLAGVLDLGRGLKSSLLRNGAAAPALSTMLWSSGSPVFSGSVLKSPFEYRLPPAELCFCRAAAASIRPGGAVLAPASVGWVLGVLRPDVAVDANPPSETRYPSRAVQVPGEQEYRITAREVVTRGADTAAEENALIRAIRDGVDYIVTPAGVDQSVIPPIAIEGPFMENLCDQ